MSRRRTSALDDLFEVLQWLFSVVHPAWSLPVAAIFIAAPVLWIKDKPFLSAFVDLAYMAGGIAAVVSLTAGLAGWKLRQKRAAFLQQQLNLEWLNQLTWQDFERQVAEVYRQRGYQVEENGGGGADGGVDLRLRRNGRTSLVQCKRWKTYKVGVQPVRELYGVMAAEYAAEAIFIISGIYTEEALRFAEGKPLELIDGAQLAQMFQQVQAGLRQPAPPAMAASAPRQPTAPETPARPQCPQCGGAMALRCAKTGPHAGKEFWGCRNFQRCRGLRECD
jgi:restriction system protein